MSVLMLPFTTIPIVLFTLMAVAQAVPQVNLDQRLTHFFQPTGDTVWTVSNDENVKMIWRTTGILPKSELTGTIYLGYVADDTENLACQHPLAKNVLLDGEISIAVPNVTYRTNYFVTMRGNTTASRSQLFTIMDGSGNGNLTLNCTSTNLVSRQSNTEESNTTVLPFYPFPFPHSYSSIPTTTTTPTPTNDNTDHQSYTAGSASSSTPLSSTGTPASRPSSSATTSSITPASNSGLCTCGAAALSLYAAATVLGVVIVL